MSTSKGNSINISEELQKWVFRTLELGFDCFSEGDYQPFIFLVNDDGEKDMIDVVDPNGNIDPNLIETAREIITKSCPFASLYIIVSAGYLHKDGTKYDAVVAEAGEKGEKDSFVFAQRYLENSQPESFEKIGKPAIVNIVENLLNYDC
jgi:hypothetical protein